MNIVLLEPEIPYNTGNIGRTCVTTGSSLHIIKPIGFSLDEKSVRRAGLDYWKHLDLHVYESFEAFMSKNNNPRVFMGTTKAKQRYDQVAYDKDSFIMFGKESAGIPEELLLLHKEDCIRIPMIADTRSLNLSNAAAIVLYEALRQVDFEGLENEGQLHRYKW